MSERFSIWHMSRKRRFAFLAIAAAVFVGAYSVGAATTMCDEEAQSLKHEFESQIKGVEGSGIFLNNIKIALTMFIPGFGVFIGMFSAYSTGLVFSALAQTTSEIADLPPLIILATPFGIMEVFSYGMAMSQSGILINEILRKRSLKPWVVPTLIQLGIVVAVLLAAAFIEFYMIEQFTPEIAKT